MKLRELGEDKLVDRITKLLPLGDDVLVGPGDDCAVIGKHGDAHWTLLKTDAVLEGVHFEPGENMARVGWKALCRAISDIAAMGGVPSQALVTVALPGDWEVAQLDALYSGLQRAAVAYGVNIVGGETSQSLAGVFISVALTGWVEPSRCVLRSGGKPGDAIYVTGDLGGSLAGRHLSFEPRLNQARWLGEHFTPSAMMDLSDGLAKDLPRLAQASGCRFEVWTDSVPMQKGCTLDQALGDGEDFELLFTMQPQDDGTFEQQWHERFPLIPMSRIGVLVEKKDGQKHGGIFIAHPGAKAGGLISTHRGYDHFA